MDEECGGYIYARTGAHTAWHVERDWNFKGCTGCAGGPGLHQDRCILSGPEYAELREMQKHPWAPKPEKPRGSRWSLW